MKIFFLSLLLVVAIVGNLRAQQFEGALSIKATNYEDSVPRIATYSILLKGNLVTAKIEDGSAESHGGTFIFRGDKKVMWVIDDEKKQFLEISSEKGMELGAAAGRHAPSQKKVKLTRTGKKQTLLGYPCDELVANDSNEVTRIWGTSKLGDVFDGISKAFGEIGGKGGKGNEGWQGELVRRKIFPLKIEVKQDGITTGVQEVTRIEPRSVPASTFDPPTGYTKQSLDDQLEQVTKMMQEQMKKMGKDSSGESIDLEKMMKQMQEQGGRNDSTNEDR